MRQAEVEDLYRHYGPSVHRRARSILGDEDAARDVMQEVFVRVLRSGDTFRGEASPMTWLYRITTNYCLNRIRDSARQRTLLEARGGLPEVNEAPEQDLRLTLIQLLAGVSEELQEIAIYHYVDQMSHKEIAEMVGVSRRTIGNRLAAFREAARARTQPTEAA